MDYIKLNKEAYDKLATQYSNRTHEIDDEEAEGIFEKKDYSGSVSRFRHKYTKESFENIISESGFNLYKPYVIKENDRNKLWYVMVCNKK